MNKVGVVVLFIVLCSCVHAAKIFDSYVNYGETFSVDGEDFQLISAEKEYESDLSETSLVLKSDKYGVFGMEYKTPYRIGPYEFEYTNRRDNLSCEESESSSNCLLFGRKTWFEYKLAVDKTEPSITMTRQISNTSLFYLDLITINVTLTNDGEAQAYNITYSEPIPYYYVLIDDYKIHRGANAQKFKGVRPQNTIYWRGNLAEDEAVSISYDYQLIKLPKADNYVNLPAINITYRYKDLFFEDEVAEEELEVEYPYGVVINKSTPPLGLENSINQTENYFVTIRNNHSNRYIEVNNLSIEIPRSFIVDDRSNELNESSSREFYWSGRLAPEQEKEFFLDMKATRSGNYSLNVFSDTEYFSVKRTMEHELNMTIKDLVVVPIINITRINYESGQDIKIDYMLNNSERVVTFPYAKLFIESDLFPTKMYTTEIPANIKNSYLLVHSESFVTPSVSEATDFSTTFHGIYRTQNLQEYAFNITKTIPIKPRLFEHSIEITPRLEVLSHNRVLVHLDLELINEDALLERVFVVSKHKDSQNERSLSAEEVGKLVNTKTFSVDIPLTLLSTEGNITITNLVSYTTNNEHYVGILNVTPEVEIIEELANLSLLLDVENETANTSVTNETIVSEAATTITTVESKRSPLPLIIGGVIIILAGVGGVIWYKRKPTEEKHEEEVKDVPEPSFDHSQLEGYVKYQKGKLMSNDTIKQNLIQKGWVEDVIDLYLQ